MKLKKEKKRMSVLRGPVEKAILEMVKGKIEVAEEKFSGVLGALKSQLKAEKERLDKQFDQDRKSELQRIVNEVVKL